MAEAIRLFIVEDEHLYRDLLATVLRLDPQLHVIGSFAGAEEALAAAQELRPDVALLDIELGGPMNGVQLGLRLRERLPKLGLVLLSNVRAPRLFASLPVAEAAGWSYLLKGSVRDAGVVRRAIDGAASGLVTLDPSLVSGRRARDRGPLSSLTPRQLQILALVAEGRTNEAIAGQLSLSVKTIENQLVLVYEALGLDRERDPVHPRVKAVLAYITETRDGSVLPGGES